jgi:hypothetical protein
MRPTPHRRAGRALVAVAAATALSWTGVGPATAHDGGTDHARQVRDQYPAGTAVPLIASSNVRLVATAPGSAGISGCFMRTAPLFVTSNLDSVKVYDVRDPLRPTMTGMLPSVQFENEAVNCGERRTADGIRRFALIGIDLVQASPGDIEHVNVRPLHGYEMVVVDVTDPANPFVRSRAASTTSTHTVTCVADTDCRYAYTAGNDKSFSIIDLRDLDQPAEVDRRPAKGGVQPFASPTGGHKWNFDEAGYGTHTGWGGAGIFDVTKPRKPRLVTTTGAAGRGEDPRHPGWNDFILHNSYRPNADAFRPRAKPSFGNGNVLLVTEEDYEQTDCTKAGSFQTWWVKRLDGTPGAIVPLDKVELSDLGTFPVPHYAFCSSHWFDYHPSGIVTAGFYGGGTQLIDVRDPRHLKPYGHATWGVSEVWDSYWVPAYDKRGVATGKRTNLAYSVDLARGLDVYAVDLPGRTWTSGGLLQLASADRSVPLSWQREGVPLALAFLVALGVGGLGRRRRRTG